MNISLKSYMPAIATGILTLAACSPLTNKYSRNLPDSEKIEIMMENSGPMQQSKLDSIAYRKLFIQSNVDSNKIEEFNKIASNMRGYHRFAIDERTIQDHIITSAKKKGMNTSNFNMNTILHNATETQYEADKWAYGKFFKQMGLMKEKGFKENFKTISNKIKPSLF